MNETHTIEAHQLAWYWQEADRLAWSVADWQGGDLDMIGAMRDERLHTHFTAGLILGVIRYTSPHPSLSEV